VRLFALALLFGLGGPAALAQPVEAPEAPRPVEAVEAPDAAALAAEVHEAWNVLPVQNGVVLEPRDEEAGFRAVEITAGGVAVDGELLTDEQLDARLGARADLVRRLSGLGPEELRAVLLPAAGGIPGEPAPPPPVEVPEIEEPAAPRPPVRVRSGEKVVFADSLVIEADESAREAVVIGGSLTVDGRVEGDAVVIGGSARINGEVGREVTVVGGTLRLGPHAHIGRDVTLVGSRVEREEGAVVEGEINEVALFGDALRSESFRDALRDMHVDVDDHRPLRPFRWLAQVMWKIVSLAIVALLMCVVVLFGDKALERIDAKLAAEPWKAAAVGFLSQVLFLFLLPLTVVLLILSIIGIPLLILIPVVVFVALVAAFVGYTAAALRVGRLFEHRFGWNLASPYSAVLVGLVAIQVWGVLAQMLDVRFLSAFSILIGVLAFLVWYAAITAGFGALLLAWMDRRRAAAAAAGGEPAPLPPTPSSAPTPPLPSPQSPEPAEGLPEGGAQGAEEGAPGDGPEVGELGNDSSEDQDGGEADREGPPTLGP
jgi:hypothetical protein